MKCTSLLPAGIEIGRVAGDDGHMLYQAYQAQTDFMMPVRAFANLALGSFGRLNGYGGHPAIKNLSAAYELISRAGLTHTRPPFGIASVMVGNREVEVTEEAALVTPFGTLLRFRKDVDIVQPRVLLVAPLSGHFATLLRATVRTLLPEHDVYITDWHNARDVALGHGRFGFDDYVEHLIRFLDTIGPGAHMVAVCQPCVAALVAAAVMAQDNHPAQPRSMTLMAGPIDCRVNPTRVNALAVSKPISWFEQNLIATVPLRHPGAFRRVYPGFVQLTAFMSMNIERHVKAHRELYDHIAAGDTAKAQVTKAFYDEYFAVLDLTAEFYLETVRLVFQDYALPAGTLTFRGTPVEPRAIRRTALFTVEGERDDICAVGQTVAAQDLCSSIRPYRRRHHMQPGVGHYGVFSGKKWEAQIYPLLKNVILAND
jgi:polyhydroxyalkanoate depolymerase